MKKTALYFTIVALLVNYLFIFDAIVNAKESNLNSSLSNSPNNKSGQLSAEKLVNLGANKAKLGHFQEAINDFSIALAVPNIKDSTKATALMNRGLAKIRLDLSREAIEDYDMALAVPNIRNNTKANAFNKRGAAKGNLGRFEEALQDFRAALAIPEIDDETKADALYNRDISSSALTQQLLDLPLPSWSNSNYR